MNRFWKIPASILCAEVSILVFGWMIGKAINTIFPYHHNNQARTYNLYTYSLDQFIIPIYYFFPIYLIPYFILLYLLIIFMRKKNNFSFYLKGLIFLTSYFCYGFLVFGNQFWHVKNLFEDNKFIKWLSSEHRDLYFSVSSLLGCILFVIIVNRFYSPLASKTKV